MQAISVQQPWAWAIARGHRPLSNQVVPTTYRGPLLVHASMRVDLKSSDSPLMQAAGWDPADPLATFGAVIAVAELTDVCVLGARRDATVTGDRCECGAWAEPGFHHWRLADVRPLPRPIVSIGRPGIWEPEPVLVATIEAVLGKAELNG